MCPFVNVKSKTEIHEFLSVVGQETDTESKTLRLKMFTCDKTKTKKNSRDICISNPQSRDVALKGKTIILLQNKMNVVITEENGAQEKRYSELSYIPFTREVKAKGAPRCTKVTYTRE